MIHHFEGANRLPELEEAVQALTKASKEGVARGAGAVLSLAGMPEARLRMRKIRRGWFERAVETKILRFSLSGGEGEEGPETKKKSPAPSKGKGKGKKGGYNR